jgi:hypothetical protein
MTRYLAARAVGMLITLALMSFVVYVLIGLMPGDPIDMMIAGDPKMTSADAARLRALYGLDKPLVERYLAWALQAAQGNFGYSRSFGQPVLAVLGPRLLNTLTLAGLAFVLSAGIALPLIHAAGPTISSTCFASPASQRRLSGWHCCSSPCSPCSSAGCRRAAWPIRARVLRGYQTSASSSATSRSLFSRSPWCNWAPTPASCAAR